MDGVFELSEDESFVSKQCLRLLQGKLTVSQQRASITHLRNSRRLRSARYYRTYAIDLSMPPLTSRQTV
jgi:hypothetical protein